MIGTLEILRLLLINHPQTGVKMGQVTDKTSTPIDGQENHESVATVVGTILIYVSCVYFCSSDNVPICANMRQYAPMYHVWQVQSGKYDDQP